MAMEQGIADSEIPSAERHGAEAPESIRDWERWEKMAQQRLKAVEDQIDLLAETASHRYAEAEAKAVRAEAELAEYKAAMERISAIEAKTRQAEEKLYSLFQESEARCQVMEQRASRAIEELDRLKQPAEERPAPKVDRILAPNGGRVVLLMCKEGQRVQAGERLVRITRGTPICAPRDGVVQSVLVKEDTCVQQGQTLLTLA